MAKGISKELARGLLELEPSSVLEFFLIFYNYEENPSEFIPIHAGSNGIGRPIYWQGIRYMPFNVEGSSWEKSNDQNLPRPKLRVSNQGLIVSTLMRKYNNLNGAKVIRKRTLAKFIDNQNFHNGQNPYGDENFNAGFPDEKYYISRKISETKTEVEFELVTPLELENQRIPNRKVHSLRCGWVYRGYGCRYNGPPVADQEDSAIVDEDLEVPTTSDLVFKASNSFYDLSKSDLHEKDFTDQNPLYGDFQNIGLYSADGGTGHFPYVDTSVNSPFAPDSFYFDGTGVVCLSVGRNPANGPHQLTHPSGAGNMSSTVCFWAKPYSGAGWNPSDRRYIVDFGDSNGGFSLYTKGSGANTVGYGASVRISGGATTQGVVDLYHPDNKNIFNTWNFVALTYKMDDQVEENNKATLYVNGEVISTASLTGISGTAYELATRLEAVSTGANGIGGPLISTTDMTGDIVSFRSDFATTASPFAGIRTDESPTLLPNQDNVGPSGDKRNDCCKFVADEQNLWHGFYDSDFFTTVAEQGKTYRLQYEAYCPTGNNQAFWTVPYNLGVDPYYPVAGQIAGGIANCSGVWGDVDVTFTSSVSNAALGLFMLDANLVGSNWDPSVSGDIMYVRNIRLTELAKNFYKGNLADFRVYNEALPASYLNQIYQNQRIAGFHINDLTDKGEWKPNTTYSRGDYVFIEGKKYKMFSTKRESGFEGIKFVFLCLNDGVTSDPRSDSTNWYRDACSKSIGGCSMRFGNSLPFGGFPGTHRYPFSATQNGY